MNPPFFIFSPPFLNISISFFFHTIQLHLLFVIFDSFLTKKKEMHLPCNFYPRVIVHPTKYIIKHLKFRKRSFDSAFCFTFIEYKEG
jgi:hypothetical protein